MSGDKIGRRRGICRREQLNTKISNLHVQWVYEVLTCSARSFREYIFPNLPEHTTSIPVVIDASSDMTGVQAFRDVSTTGKVKIYSPIQQDVHVMLVLLK